VKDTVILFHSYCPDGFGGAWAAREKFGKKADYIAIRHHEVPPLGLDNKDVYMIDIVYPEKDVKQLIKKTKSFTVLDHHVTTKDVVEAVPNHVYDIDHSGAVLAWEYFFPEKETPLYLKYIEDIDLWKFELPRAEDFLAFSATIPFDFEKWDKVVEEFEDEKKRNSFLDRGKNLLEYQNKLIGEVIEIGEEADFDGHSSLVVNSSVLQSQLGNAIIKKGYDIGVVWAHSNDVIRVSLRSSKDGDVNVGEIAQKYGGGGHKSAAGFVIKEEGKFPWQPKK